MCQDNRHLNIWGKAWEPSGFHDNRNLELMPPGIMLSCFCFSPTIDQLLPWPRAGSSLQQTWVWHSVASPTTTRGDNSKEWSWLALAWPGVCPGHLWAGRQSTLLGSAWGRCPSLDQVVLEPWREGKMESSGFQEWLLRVWFPKALLAARAAVKKAPSSSSIEQTLFSTY